MIQEDNEFQIYFTRDDIRDAAGEYVKEDGRWKLKPANLTDEQCDAIAEQIAGWFDDDFRMNVRNAEV